MQAVSSYSACEWPQYHTERAFEKEHISGMGIMAIWLVKEGEESQVTAKAGGEHAGHEEEGRLYPSVSL